MGPIGPVDVTVEGNKIVSIQNVGYPGLEIKEEGRPKLKKGGKEIDAQKMYLCLGSLKCTAISHLRNPEKQTIFISYGWHMALRLSATLHVAKV